MIKKLFDGIFVLFMMKICYYVNWRMFIPDKIYIIVTHKLFLNIVLSVLVMSWYVAGFLKFKKWRKFFR